MHLCGKVKAHHGVLVFAVIHLFHAFEDLISHYEEFEKSAEERENVEHLLNTLKLSYDTAEEAAKAYDKVAVIRFGVDTPLNFEKSKRHSKYRGVVWNAATKRWKVDADALSLQSYE